MYIIIMNLTLKFSAILFVLLFLVSSCKKKEANTQQSGDATTQTYTNPLLQTGARPWATYHNGNYYYLQDSDNKIDRRPEQKNKSGLLMHRPSQRISRTQGTGIGYSKNIIYNINNSL